MISRDASHTSRLKRLVHMWIAAAIVLVVSIGETAAQPKPGETTTQPKQILLLQPFGPNFEFNGHMAQGNPQRTESTVALATGHSGTVPRHGSEWRRRY